MIKILQQRKHQAKLSAVRLGRLLFAVLAVAGMPHMAEAGSKPVDIGEGSEVHTLHGYLELAIASNPGLQASFSQWQAAVERIAQARSLPDPSVSYSYFVSQTSMTKQTISLAQTFPWYGKLKAQTDAASNAALAAEQRFEQARLALIARVKDTYAEYSYLRQALDVLEENRAILQGFKEAARARFEIGVVPFADVVRAEVALEKAEDEIVSLHERRRSIVAQLNATIGRASDAELPWPAVLEQRKVEVEEEQLLARLVSHNPELTELRHLVERGEDLVRAARQNWVPDLRVGVEYMDMRQRDNEVAVMASINLPIWVARRGAERAEALAEQKAASFRQVDRENELLSLLHTAYYRFRDADRRTLLFGQRLIPMAREALEATEGAYAAGEAAFQALTQTQTDLRELQLSYHRALADRFQQVAELERLVGGELHSVIVPHGGPNDQGSNHDTGGGEK